MSNIASILKSEISRLSRKEIRAEIAHLKTTVTQQRGAIAALRKELTALGKKIRGVAKREPRISADSEQPVRHRFRVQGLLTHRKALGLSAENYGKLVGVTGLTIYKWEKGVHPRAKQLEALAAIRGMGKRQAQQRLQEIEAAEAKAAPKPARAASSRKARKRRSVRRRAAAA